MKFRSRIGICWNEITCYPCTICNRRKIHQRRKRWSRSRKGQTQLTHKSPKIIFKKLAETEIQLTNWQITSHLFNERLQGEGGKALNQHSVFQKAKKKKTKTFKSYCKMCFISCQLPTPPNSSAHKTIYILKTGLYGVFNCPNSYQIKAEKAA